MEGEYHATSQTLSIKNHHWFKGGPEIPSRVTVAVKLGENNIQVMKRYEELVNEHCNEPVNGLFDNMMTSVLKALVLNESESDMKDDIGK